MPVAPADASGLAPDLARAAICANLMERLRHRADFLAARAGVRTQVAGFVLELRQRGDAGPPRVGFTVSKKVGTAVERNRVRRRLREIVRKSGAEHLQPGRDYVLVGRRAALHLPFDRLVEDLSGALNRVHGSRNRDRHADKTSSPPR